MSEFRLDMPVDVNDDLVQSSQTDMCVSPNGTVYVVWVDDRSGSPDVWMNRKLPDTGSRDQGWLPDNAPVKVNQVSGQRVFLPQVACTDQQVHVVWEDDRDGEVESHQIYYQRSNDRGATWNTDDELLEVDEDGRTNSFEPKILVRENNVFVTWYDDQNGAYDILTVRSPDGGNNWQDPVRVDQDVAGQAFSAHPEIAADSTGENVYIVWEDFRNGIANPEAGSDIYFNRSTDQGNNFNSVDLRLDGGEAGAASAFAPRITAANDDVYVVWHDDRQNTNDVWMAHSRDGGTNWAPDSRANLEDPAGLNDALYPKVCLSNGTAHIVWHDDRTGGFYRVFYNTAVDGSWTGGETRLDSYKADGVGGVWRLLGGGGAVQVDCVGDEVLVAWLDTEFDIGGAGFNDIAYNYSADGGTTWTVGIRDDITNHGPAPYRLDSWPAGTSFKKELDIRILPGAQAYASWTDGRSGTEDIFFQQLTAGESAAVCIAEDSGEAVSCPSHTP